MLTLAQLKSRRSTLGLSDDGYRNELNKKQPLRKCQSIIEADIKSSSKALQQTNGYRFIRVQSGLCKSGYDSDTEGHRVPKDARIRLGDFQTVYHFRSSLPELDTMDVNRETETLFKVLSSRFLALITFFC